MRRDRLWYAHVLIGLPLSACGGSGNPTVAPPTPPTTPPAASALASITVSLDRSTLVAGQTAQASATGRDRNGQPIAIGTVAWSSSAPAVATVASSGLVTAVAAGSATISASAGGLTASASLSVTAAPVLTTLSLRVANPSLVSGTSITAQVHGIDQFGAPIATGPLTWNSSAPAVARVSESGEITGILAGPATITARAGTGANVVQGTVALVVSHGPAVRIAITQNAEGALNGGAFTTPPVVQVQDAAGNTVLSNSSTTVTASVSGASLLGVTTRTVTDGVATFVGLGVRGTTGASATVLFRAGSFPPCAPVVTIQPFTFGSGTRMVSTDVPPGRYRSVNAATGSCYWARLRNTAGTAASIIANDIGAGPRLVEIVASDVAFESNRCGPWTEVTGPVTTSVTAPFGDGVYLVGVDIQPGVWRSDGTGTNCYWARLRNVRGEGDVIENVTGTSPTLVAIGPSDLAFKVSRCGNWTRVP
ncbi:MAG: Ig-like domain-containing protein [Gemmatimonas sp.]|uniref:Ig-like domain-containing protein n=1 Tax=Gemmatimonas sp. TaxID=1962908 RepID=UPI00391F36FA